ncbi:uncharacterized protein I303_102097 [Kwoniella dejecticola CBS 10117]|uniref:Uncharacterized protein n=1 Tax=Kwoniella dejecticola CBS 10117 TaxID=1296121 RepID=A0AAJ8MEQ3_9TREE
MPAIRNKPSKPLAGTPISSSSDNQPQTPTKGWTKDQKRQLFYHVIKHGETEWKFAVDGKTGHQVRL